MAYFDWHGEPGYWADVTRHFDPAESLLDVGCGDAWLSRHFPNYIGVDASPEAVEAARKHGVQVEPWHAGERLPVEDASVDGVVLKDLLEHVPEPIDVVREAFRVVRPGGRVFASSPDAQRWVWSDYTHRRPFTRTGFKRMFRDAGFDVVTASYESVMPGTGIVSKRMPNHRRPAPLRLAAWLPIVRRNVWLLARRPG